jgi:hypothetical protein
VICTKVISSGTVVLFDAHEVVVCDMKINWRMESKTSRTSIPSVTVTVNQDN